MIRTVRDDPVADPRHLERLSDPPRFTACRNPRLAREVARIANDRPHPAPAAFRGILRARGRHPIAAVHPYHTKAPPEAIRRLIAHYTEPGDVVLDPFCGSGMTGVAAQAAGRHAVLCDLSPLAALTASVNAHRHGPAAVEALEALVGATEADLGRLYRTPSGGVLAYAVWTDRFTCPSCGGAFPFFGHGARHLGRKVRTLPSFPCPHCGAALDVRRVRRILRPDGSRESEIAWIREIDPSGRTVERPPRPEDLEQVDRIAGLDPPVRIPRDPIDTSGRCARLAQLEAKGIVRVDRLMTRRNAIAFAALLARAFAIEERAVRNAVVAALLGSFTVVSERQGYFGGGGGMSGNLYMPIVRMERNVFRSVRRKIARVRAAEAAKAPWRSRVFVSTQSATDLGNLPAASIDFAFTDPPFAANTVYSELNHALECWLGARTRTEEEAVESPAQGKDEAAYLGLLARAIREIARVLKPGRFLALEFHNARASVWNGVLAALAGAAFAVEGTARLEKPGSTILQDIRPWSVRGDVVIMARKRADGGAAGDGPAAEEVRARPAERDALDRIARALERLPAGPAPGRRTRHLYSLYVAACIERGVRVRLSARELPRLLRRRFVERGGRWYARGGGGGKP